MTKTNSYNTYMYWKVKKQNKTNEKITDFFLSRIFSCLESTTLDPWGSQSAPPTKEHTRPGPRPSCSYLADVQLGLYVGSK